MKPSLVIFLALVKMAVITAAPYIILAGVIATIVYFKGFP